MRQLAKDSVNPNAGDSCKQNKAMLRSDKKKREQSNRRARHQWDGEVEAHRDCGCRLVVEALRFGQHYFLLPCRSRCACSRTLILQGDIPTSAAIARHSSI
jgi:hypothetical protein